MPLSFRQQGGVAVAKSFEFKECVILQKSTGEKAGTIAELRRVLATISPESIVHHTSHYALKGHILEYTNEFAHWAGESLQERSLAEHLSNIDPYAFEKVDDLRAELIRVIDDYLAEFPRPREAIAGEEFYFGEGFLIVFGTGLRVRNLAEFLMAVRYVGPASIYFHFFEAREHLPKGANDFSSWLADLGKTDLAARIAAVDPMMHDLESIRRRLTEAVEIEVRNDMEGPES
jgi:hypothetical protein